MSVRVNSQQLQAPTKTSTETATAPAKPASGMDALMSRLDQNIARLGEQGTPPGQKSDGFAGGAPFTSFPVTPQYSSAAGGVLGSNSTVGPRPQYASAPSGVLGFAGSAQASSPQLSFGNTVHPTNTGHGQPRAGAAGGVIGFERSAGSTGSGGHFKPVDAGHGQPKAGAAGGVIGFEKSAGSAGAGTGFKPLDPSTHKPMYASAPAGVLFAKAPGAGPTQERPDLMVRGHAGAAGGVLEGKALSSRLEAKGTGSGGVSLLHDKGGGSAAGGVLGAMRERAGGAAPGGVLGTWGEKAGGAAPGGVLGFGKTATSEPAASTQLQKALATKAGGWVPATQAPSQDDAFKSLDQAILGLRDRYGNEPVAAQPTAAPAQPLLLNDPLLDVRGRGVVNASQHNGKGNEWLDSHGGGGAAGGVLGDL